MLVDTRLKNFTACFDPILSCGVVRGDLRPVGVEPFDDPGRIEAGIAYTLNRMAEDGHVYMPQEELEPDSSFAQEVLYVV